MRIAIVHKERCHAKKCGTECILYCPRVRTGDETVVIGPEGKAVISEELCVGCGICIEVCPWTIPGRGPSLSEKLLSKR